MKDKSKVLNILDLKELLMLTILGSYEGEAVNELIKLRDRLRLDGYTKCRVVSDYSYPSKEKDETYDEYFNRKSIFWLEHSDACIFVFLDGVNNDGVAFELQHTCDHLEGKLDTCMVTIDMKARRYTTSLLRGKISVLVKGQKINQRFFVDSDQLFEFASSACLSFLKKRRYYLMDRHSL